MTNIHWNLSPKELANIAIKKGQACLTSTGAININTGEFTGRSPKDRFIVLDNITKETVWWGDINIPFEKQKFEYCFLHGPLQTPIMPFSGPEFPLFKKNVIKTILPFFKIDESSDLDRHFINVYLSSINYIKKSK